MTNSGNTIFSTKNPVIYDNDSHADTYTDELLMALASTGRITLKGLITTSPGNVYVNADTLILDTMGREELVRKARRSGMKNIPDAVKGPFKVLEMPASRRIEDTVPIDSPGSRLIVEEALRTTPDNPLLLIMGGPLTVAVDAYLLNPSIADKMVIGWVDAMEHDMSGYNGWVDCWASYIALKKLKMVHFPAGKGYPSVPKERLAELPVTELRQWMIDKMLPHASLPNEMDPDSHPVIAMLRPDYIQETRRVSFDRWVSSMHQKQSPAYKEDPEGTVRVAAKVNQEIATEVWWEVMKDPRVWAGHERYIYKAQRPFYAMPMPIGIIARIEAEDFDHGEEGSAYYKKNKCYEEEKYREIKIAIKNAGDIQGGYNVGVTGGFYVDGLQEGDWLAYTLDILREGLYDLRIRVASQGKGGVCRVEFDEYCNSGTCHIPDTGGWLLWKTMTIHGLYLRSGVQRMKFVVEGNGDNGVAANINYFEFTSVHCTRSRRS